MRRVLLISTLAAGMATAAAATTWTIGEGSEVVFTSKAPMESFDGKTKQVSGHITCDPDDLAGPLDLRIAVDLASIDTGIGMRNTHMRERHLETDQFPEAVFTGTSIVATSSPALVAGEVVHLTIRGTFDLHGVAQPRDIEADVTLAGDGSLIVEARFSVSLEDHDIDRPQFLVMKLADEQQVRVSLSARPGGD
jgi:polyisoprenoid-binding protein YceI